MTLQNSQRHEILSRWAFLLCREQITEPWFLWQQGIVSEQHTFFEVFFFLSLWFFVLFNLLSDTCLRCDVLRKEGKLLQKKKHERRENRRMPNNFRAHQTTCLIILICKECKNKVLNLPKRQIRQFVVTMACICTLFRLVSVAENIFQMYSTELFQKISISFHFLLLYNCWHCCI